MEHTLSDEDHALLTDVLAKDYYSEKEKKSAQILLDLHDSKAVEDICELREVKKSSVTVCINRWKNYKSLLGKKSIIKADARESLSPQQLEQLEDMLTAHGVKDLDRVRAHVLLLLDDGTDPRKIVEDYELEKIVVGRMANLSVNQIDSLIFTYYRPIFSDQAKAYLKSIINTDDGHESSARKKSSKILLLMNAGMNDAEISRTTSVIRDRVRLERHRIFKHFSRSADAQIEEYFKSGIGE